jgi:putative hydrolase of the HAD superfamily
MEPTVYREPEGERNAPRRANAVLVDLDDTLFDQGRAVRGGLDAVAARFDALAALPIEHVLQTHDEWLDRLHATVLSGELSVDDARRIRLGRLLEAAGISASDADLDVAAREYRRGYVASWCAIEGAAALLARLRRDARVAVVSNNTRDEQVGKLRACGLDRLIDELVVWEDVRIAKPDPAMFRVALERLGARPETAVVLGDSWSADVMGAAAAGMRAVWFNRRGVDCPDASLAIEIRALVPTESIAGLVLGEPPTAAERLPRRR